MQASSARRFCLGVVVFLLTAALNGSAGHATELVLKDGRVLRGKQAKVSSLGELPANASSDSAGLQLIVVIDDDLRRMFISDRQIREVRAEEGRPIDEKFAIRQRVLRSGSAVRTVGPPVRIQPFDEFGRRIFTMLTGRGPVDVVQGITELTPHWAKVEGISHIWDMRVATSSIPRDVLHKILLKQIDPKKPEDYKKIARFYLQAERYEEARAVLDALLQALPDNAQLKEQLEPSLRVIKQLAAQRLTKELKLRHDCGQHELAWATLKKFPSEGVGGDVLQGVREMLEDYEKRFARGQTIVKQLQALAKRVPDMISRENLKPILEEMATEINLNTMDRMAAFLQSADDAQTPDSEKLALAISGWLLGADAATNDLPTAISAYRVRRLIREYLSQSVVVERERTFGYFQQEPAGKCEMVSEILAHMKPVIDPPEPVADKPGYYQLEVPGLVKEHPITYYVQLPPEYDPYRLYPTIVTLNGAGTNAQQQIDWWAGDWKEGRRVGQAARNGYIVIAPVWTVDHQKTYGYSAREHAAVLNSLRDACRRFAIDTDRVFLSGHSMGGDAVWDIGLAHPDLWAGVIPIVAQSDRYCNLYWENARYVPFYLVAGELDGAKLVRNARDLDRYLRRGFNTTVVEFRGRGHEDFYDDVLSMFEWMSHFRRNFYPREFTCQTMRTWDNFFWWVELEGLPPRSIVDPTNWPPSAGALPVQVKAALTNKNGITVRTGTSQLTVWLSPKMVDFKQRMTITVNGRRFNGPDQMVRPDLKVLLEDVRTRGDRLHPFWAKVSGGTGRGRAGE